MALPTLYSGLCSTSSLRGDPVFKIVSLLPLSDPLCPSGFPSRALDGVLDVT